MADYYPLLSRAIAGLAGRSDVDRHAIYGRAREALERQLRGFEPAIAEAGIRSELDALEATIARIEAEQAVPEAVAPHDVMPEDSAAPASIIEVEPKPAEPAASSESTPPAEPQTVNPPVAPSITGPSPFKAIRPTVSDLPPKEEMPAPAATFLDEATRGGSAPERAEMPTLAEEPPVKDSFPEADSTGKTSPGEALAETNSPDDALALQPMLRPRMPARREDDHTGRKKPLALFAGVAVVAMLVMGFLAMSRRDTPNRAQVPPVVVAPDANPDASKTEGRLANSDAPAKPPEQKETAPLTQPKSEETPKTAAPAPDTRPVQETRPATPPAAVVAPAGNRAFMVLEVPGGAPNQFEGKTTWSFAPDPSLKGQKTLRALIDFPTGGLAADFSIARNSDPAMGFSHTVMVIFDTKNVESVREMSAIEWRERESQAGTVLAGIVVPIQDNVFMFGLDKADAARARNLDLLRTQKWMVFEVRLTTGRRGAVLVEKGGSGDKAIADALADWK